MISEGDNRNNFAKCSDRTTVSSNWSPFSKPCIYLFPIFFKMGFIFSLKVLHPGFYSRRVPWLTYPRWVLKATESIFAQSMPNRKYRYRSFSMGRRLIAFNWQTYHDLNVKGRDSRSGACAWIKILFSDFLLILLVKNLAHIIPKYSHTIISPSRKTDD